MSQHPSLSVYVPDLLLERLAEGFPPAQDEWQPLYAATFFADLAGFTAMADRLAERGSQGPEQLTAVLDEVFGALIDLVLQHGGDVVRFAGDAIQVIWRADGPEGLQDAVLRAATCALDALATPLQHPLLPGVSLRLRVGISAGPVRFVRVGGLLERFEFLLTGAPLHSMGVAAEAAAAGQVLVAEPAWELLAGLAAGAPARDGCWRLTSLHAPTKPRARRERARFPSVGDAAVRPFIPGAVRYRHDAGIDRWLAELRPLSVLFINLPTVEGQPPPERAQLQQLVHLTQRELYRFEGAVDKLLMDDKGCTLLAAFGLPPLAHEDDPERALRAGLAISAHLRVRGVPHRIGVATGRVYAGAYGHRERREYSVLGDTVNLAARLMQQARDEVLCCRATSRAVGGRVELEALPPARVKGKPDPVERFRPVRALDALPTRVRNSALEGRMVGREHERALLDEALQELCERGQGGLLLIQGEAGIGKSTLLAWLLERAGELGVRPRLGSGDAIERSSAYRAWRPILAELLGVTEEVALDGVHASVRRALSGHPNAALWAPLLGGLLPVDLAETGATAAMSGAVRAENTRDLLVHILRGQAAAEPLLILIEDAHWLDPASWALVATVQRRVPSALLVLATRPLSTDPPPELGTILADGARGRLIEMSGLSPAEVGELAERTLGVDELPSSARKLLLERAEGNPLYTGELATALLDLGVLERDGRRCRLRQDDAELAELRLPDTVQAAVTSRLDRLDPQQQLTLKVASVVGRLFPYRVTHDVHPVHEVRGSVEHHLRISAGQGLIQLVAPEPAVYRFQHSVTQQVAYDLLAHAQRREIHSAVARWYEGASGRDSEDELARLAYHWQRAGDDAKTLLYCTRAGERAMDRGALAEAIHFLRTAVRLMERQQGERGRPADWLHRVRIRRRLGEAYANVSESRLALEQLLEALRELGRPFPRSGVGRAVRAVVELTGLLVGAVWPSWLRRSLAEGEREHLVELARVEARVADELFALTDVAGMALASLGAIAHAERVGVYEPAVHAYNAMGYVLGSIGLRGMGERFLARAATGDAMAVCNGHYARGLWLLGDARFEDSEAEIRRGLEHARAVGDSNAIATGISCLGTRYELVGDFDAALSLWRELLLVADRMASEQFELWASTAIGGALCMRGQVEEGLDWIRRREELLAREDRMTAVGFHGQRAQAFLRAGALVQAREAAELTHQYVRETGTKIITHIKGLTGLCETLLALWEHSLEGGGAPDRQLVRSALDACRLFERYARSFPVGASRAARFSGLAARLSGKPSKALRHWMRALVHARTRGNDYDRGLTLQELLRSGLGSEAQRAAWSEELDRLGLTSASA
jgi:class 3 adenylate cyclase/tetratricopeptide (TPR) repeat protein